MRRLLAFFQKRLRLIGLNNSVIVVLLIANLLAWSSAFRGTSAPHVVEPIRDPEVVTLLEYIRSGDHSGESWQVTLTELEAEQTITWYLDRYSQIPFAHPQVEMTPDYIAGEGDATIAGLRIHVSGKARITLTDGLPVVEILALNIPLPASIRTALEAEIQRQLKRADLLPVRFSSAEWRAGEVVVRGVIK